MNNLVLADALLFIIGVVFGLCLAYVLYVLNRHIKMERKSDLRIIKGGKDESR